VIDRNMFNPARLDAGVPPFDEEPEFQYNVIPDALNLNTILLGYVLQSDEKSVKVRISPALPGVVLDTLAFGLNDKPCAQWEDSWKLPVVQPDRITPLVVFQGQFPRNCTQSLELNLLDRQWTSAMAVRQLWYQLGGKMEGPDSEGATPAGATVLASHLGRPFAEVARNMMKRSDNPMTRLTYLRIGAAAAQAEEKTLDAADRVVKEWFAANGISSDGLIMDNGSGLSRAARITPAQMAGVLAQAYRGPYASELLTTLPVAGVDGTLSRRFKGSPVQGRGRLKTGTLRNADGLAGFVTDASNRTWIVVALLNHEAASGKGRPVLDSIIEWVATQR
jgi:D-alanyl-D-alanine carboxypeptidase/D-alanyl-D-alanine-endopeptidase (penicillin-binding protein 4)